MSQKSKNLIQVIGLLFILVGVLNPGNLLATIIIDTQPPIYSATASYPSSVDANVPSIITQIGTATDFWILVRDVNGIESVQLICKSTDNVYNSGTVACFRDGTITLSGFVWDIWKWHAPALESGKLYRFEWLAKDTFGHTAPLVTFGGYGDVGGYFTINGIKVLSTTQVLKLVSYTLDVSFTVTDLPEGVMSILVKIKTAAGIVLKSTDLVKNSATDYSKTGFYTFAGDGSYIIEGYVVMSTKSIQKMSIYTELGDPNAAWTPDVFRSTLVIAGLAILVYGRQRRRD